MEFKARNIDLTLNVRGIPKEEKEGELRSFIPKERITSEFAEKIITEMNIYIDAQKSLPDSEQDRIFLSNLKFLSWIYKDFDTSWIKENFTFMEIQEIRDWVFNGLSGIKKDEES